MKTMKKLASVALALGLALSLAVPAMAANITIKLPTATEDTDPNASETYKAYKIFDADVAGETTGNEDPTDPNGTGIKFDHVAYSISDDSPFYATVNSFTGITLTELREENGVKTFNVAVDKTTFVAADLADALRTVVTAEGFDGEFVAANQAATLEQNATLDLGEGYWLIVGSLGSKAILDTVGQENVTITTKNDLPTIKKETPDIEGKKIGDSINYTITVNAKPGASKYVVHDTMGIGLTYNNDVSIEGLTAGTDYNVVTDVEDGCAFHVVFTPDYLNTIDAAKDIVISYSATINSNATLVVDTTTNKAKLDYGDNGHTEDSEETKTETPLYQFELAKTNSDQMGKEVLTGAEFSLYDVAEGGEAIALVPVEDAENGNYYRPATAEDATTTTVIEAGVVTIMGLGKGTYYLQEDVAPDGYNKLNARTPVELGPDKNLGEVVTDTTTTEGKTLYVSGGLRIENLTGAELPAAGGIGTTLFYIGGAVLALGAGILLITKKRMSAEEE